MQGSSSVILSVLFILSGVFLSLLYNLHRLSSVHNNELSQYYWIFSVNVKNIGGISLLKIRTQTHLVFAKFGFQLRYRCCDADLPRNQLTGYFAKELFSIIVQKVETAQILVHIDQWWQSDHQILVNSLASLPQGTPKKPALFLYTAWCSRVTFPFMWLGLLWLQYFGMYRL